MKHKLLRFSDFQIYVQKIKENWLMSRVHHTSLTAKATRLLTDFYRYFCLFQYGYQAHKHAIDIVAYNLHIIVILL